VTVLRGNPFHAAIGRDTEKPTPLAAAAQRDDETTAACDDRPKSGHPLAGGQVVGRSLCQNYKMLAPSRAQYLSPFLQ
jgi:hypothetical protein